MLATYGLVVLGVVVVIAVIVVVRGRGKRGDEAGFEGRIDEAPRAPEIPDVAPSEALVPTAGSSATRTIASEAARFGDLSWVLPLLGTVAAELSALHAQGLVHGSLTSKDVLLEDVAGTQAVTLTAARGAPGDVTPEDDVLAFGVLAYEMVTGKPPGTTPPDAVYPPSVALDPTLRSLLTRALSSTPAERPSASELAWLLSPPTSSSFVTSRGARS